MAIGRHLLLRPLQPSIASQSRLLVRVGSPLSSNLVTIPSRRAYTAGARLQQETKPSRSDVAPDTSVSNWDENPNLDISAFSQLPSSNFGFNQHMIINAEFKEALRQILWQFRAPIRYAFAYGSGVFPQSKEAASSGPSSVHPSASSAIGKAQLGEGKMIDFIFGVSYTQHWHSLNIQQHRDHYSALGSLGSGIVSRVQDRYGAGVYFNPYVTVNGTLIKYGVVNIDTLCRDLSEWDTLYLAGRLHKPVKILRDDPRVRLANQVNLLSAVRTALLLLPPTFTEHDLYSTIAGISYMGDPRMSLPTENRQKVNNIVTNQLANFRYLYAPLIENLPNVSFKDPRCSRPGWEDDTSTNASLEQDMDPFKRGNMVRRLPKAFRNKLYLQYRQKFRIPQVEWERMQEESNDEDATRIKRREGGGFEQQIAGDETGLKKEVSIAIKNTIAWPSMSQSVKSFLTAGFARSWRYLGEKAKKYRDGKRTKKIE
ncbi:mitochondrial matrix Mmp37 [Xylona heveae TC161]|uniref:Phosphatidate cytidylyltransferase, mitochondrial n=1 Tax=Xylona heveae (strain CBS 132557 / TC161) TaxID=1328760 RepID=A0A161TGC5_XYLHT|nr:mitochondrial matrix Mmp37 [Xylona heveae TC161]KZF25197.1 mitochondrial matrix Mmp37 [Xylona heveae TC161]